MENKNQDKRRNSQQPKVDNGKKNGDSAAQDIQERVGKKAVK